MAQGERAEQKAATAGQKEQAVAAVMLEEEAKDEEAGLQ